MSLDIVKKNSSSPFQLQRSMVDQGGSGGAYETGGYNPNAVYNNDAANEAIESLGKVVGAAIYAKGKDKDKEASQTKSANQKAIKSEADKIFKVKKDSELFNASKTFKNNQQATENVVNNWNNLKAITKK
jgi:hypothetical protein